MDQTVNKFSVYFHLCVKPLMAYYFRSMHLYEVVPFLLSGNDPSPVHYNVFIVCLNLSCGYVGVCVLVLLSEYQKTHSSVRVRTLWGSGDIFTGPHFSNDRG